MIEISLSDTEKTRLLQALATIKDDEIIKNIVYRLERAHDAAWYAGIKWAEPKGYDT